MSVEAVAEIITYLNRNDFAGASLEDALYTANERVNARYARLTLDSRFQAIVALDTDTVVAHEAFLLAQTPAGTAAIGGALPPENIFFLPADVEGITYLDRLTRTLHTLNFLIQDVPGNLHLNVHPHHLLAVDSDHGQVFETILSQCGLAPTAIVLEVAEYAIRDKAHLADAIAAWQSRGYRIAIDNFGRQHLHYDRLAKLKPDLIKIDRSFLHDALRNRNARRTLNTAIGRLRDAGLATAVVGIETTAQLAAARQAGADYVQGYLFGQPTPLCAGSVSLDEERLFSGA